MSFTGLHVQNVTLDTKDLVWQQYNLLNSLCNKNISCSSWKWSTQVKEICHYWHVFFCILHLLLMLITNTITRQSVTLYRHYGCWQGTRIEIYMRNYKHQFSLLSCQQVWSDCILFKSVMMHCLVAGQHADWSVLVRSLWWEPSDSSVHGWDILQWSWWLTATR